MKFIVLSTLIATYKASDVYTPLETNLLNTIENLLNGFVDTEYNLARKYWRYNQFSRLAITWRIKLI